MRKSILYESIDLSFPALKNRLYIICILRITRCGKRLWNRECVIEAINQHYSVLFRTFPSRKFCMHMMRQKYIQSKYNLKTTNFMLIIRLLK